MNYSQVFKASSLILGGLILTSSIASAAPKKGMQQQAQPGVAPTAITTTAGGVITGVQVVTSSDVTTTSSLSFVDLPGATTTINVPAGTRAMLLARFSAESSCYNGTPGTFAHCGVRILVNGDDMNPNGDLAFDSTNNGTENIGSWEAHSIDASSPILGPGNYKVKVQRAVSFANTQFWLDDWSLTVQRVKV
jgi:hypothetical protein